MMPGDEEDEWDEKIRQSLRYTVRLLIKHPHIDPARITDELKLFPDLSGMVGSPRTTPAGKAIQGVRTESVWSHWFRTERNRLFFRDIVKVVDDLQAHAKFLHEIVSGGGSISVIVSLPGDINIGDHFQWRDMARLSALHIDLGIEVFPDFG
jgi:hypothetical protein